MLAISMLALLTFFTFARSFTFTVTVGIDETNGQPGQGFDPSTIFPAAGDTVTFTYQLPDYIKNPKSTQHSATQSTFDDPCTPKPSGFNTGSQSTGSVNSNTGSTFNLLINDTQPLWFYSSVNTDCNSGMVLAVNPPTTGEQTAAAFKAKAQTAPIGSASSSMATSSTTSSAVMGSAAPLAKSNGATHVEMGTRLALICATVAGSTSIFRFP